MAILTANYSAAAGEQNKKPVEWKFTAWYVFKNNLTFDGKSSILLSVSKVKLF